jgi:hypothetical protein
MLFTLFKLQKNARSFAQDRAGYASDAVGGAISSLAVIPLLGMIGFLALLYVAGFTNMLGAPSVVARFFFVLCVVVSAGVAFVVIRMIRFMKRATSQTVKKAETVFGSSKVSTHIQDAELVE